VKNNKIIKDNSLEYYLTHHAAVLFGSCLISRVITVCKSIGLTVEMSLMSYLGFGLVALIIWMFWLYHHDKPTMPMIEKVYRVGMGATILIGIFLGLPV